MANWVMKLLIGLFLICEGISAKTNSTDEERGLPNIKGQDKSKPVKFLKLVGKGIKFGPGQLVISKSEARSWSKSFFESVTDENTRENSVAVSAGVALGPFTAGSEVKTGWTKSNTKTTETEEKEAAAFSESERSKYFLKAGQFLMKAAEMEMLVFERKHGRPFRIILPTLRVYGGVYSPEKLEKLGILDDSFFTLANHYPNLNIQTWTAQQIQEAMVNDGRIIKFDPAYVDQNKWYIIEHYNTQQILQASPDGAHMVNCYPKTQCEIDADPDVECPSLGPKEKMRLWKFKKSLDEDEDVYYIINKDTQGRLLSRLDKPWGGSCKPPQWCFFGTESGRDRTKLWRINRVGKGGNRYVITNLETGDTLAAWDQRYVHPRTWNNCGPQNFYCRKRPGQTFKNCKDKIEKPYSTYWTLKAV